MLKRTLVANRGEIACRILRACREAGIEGVAIYAANDAGTLFTELADISVQLEGEGLAETYLNQEQILQIAIDSGCDSIHPGFGFLSERADFAQAVMDSGLIWVGPSPDAITKMGDKMTARITMKEAGVPVIPGEEVTGGLEEVLQIAPSVGYPLLQSNRWRRRQRNACGTQARRPRKRSKGCNERGSERISVMIEYTSRDC